MVLSRSAQVTANPVSSSGNSLVIARYDLPSASGALGFVHVLLNTRSAGALAAWTEVTGQEVPAVALGEEDLDPLRDLRVDLHAHVTGTAELPEHHAGVVLRLGPDGRVRPEGAALPRSAPLIRVKLAARCPVSLGPNGPHRRHMTGSRRRQSRR